MDLVPNPHLALARPARLAAACASAGRHLLAAVMLLCLPGLVRGEERLVIMAEDDAAPWSFPDGTGSANDVVKAAFAAAGVAIDLQVVPYERAKQMVLKGTAAACFSMSWNPDYAGRIAFAAQPLFTCRCDYLQNVARPLAARSEGELKGRIVVGTVVGYEYPPSVARLRDAGAIALEESPSEELNLKKLASGRLDAILLNDNALKTAAQKIGDAGVADKVAVAFPCGELASFIGFSVVHPRGAWARVRFDAGFRIIHDDGTVRRIERAWLEKLGAHPAGGGDVPAAGGPPGKASAP